MKLLRETIRSLILQEVCAGVNAKIQQGIDEIERRNLFIRAEIDGDRGYDVILEEAPDGGGRIVGHFEVAKSTQCEPSYVTLWTEVNAGLHNTGIGAVLYDVAVEVATQLGSYLTCDRKDVSDEAKRMWRYYITSDDYEQLQLDTLRGEFTPDDKSDDCAQSVFHDDEEIPMGEYEAWMYKDLFMASPFTKAYRKKQITTIPCLGDRYSEE